MFEIVFNSNTKVNTILLGAFDRQSKTVFTNENYISTASKWKLQLGRRAELDEKKIVKSCCKRNAQWKNWQLEFN